LVFSQGRQARLAALLFTLFALVQAGPVKRITSLNGSNTSA